MNIFLEDSNVNLDDNREMNHVVDVNSNENDSENDKDIGVVNIKDKEDAVNDEYKRIADLVGDEIRILDFGSDNMHLFSTQNMLDPDVSSIEACRPRIFINGFLFFLEDEWQQNGE